MKFIKAKIIPACLETVESLNSYLKALLLQISCFHFVKSHFLDFCTVHQLCKGQSAVQRNSCWIADIQVFLSALLPVITNAYVISTVFVVVANSKSVLAAGWQMRACWLQIARFPL